MFQREDKILGPAGTEARTHLERQEFALFAHNAGINIPDVRAPVISLLLNELNGNKMYRKRSSRSERFSMNRDGNGTDYVISRVRGYRMRERNEQVIIYDRTDSKEIRLVFIGSR